MLHELMHLIGIGLELRVVNLQQGEQHSPEYLKINPFGKVPALDDGGFLIYEVSMIDDHYYYKA